MYILRIIALGLLWHQAACQFPGPRQTSKDSNGNDIWVAQGTKSTQAFTYKVQDLGKDRPTLKYNCAQAPGICQTVKAYWKNGQTSGTFHYDKDYRLGSKRNKKGVRKSKRREENCPTGDKGWKSTHTCPEPNHPKFQGEGRSGWMKAELYKGPWGDGNEVKYQLAEKSGQVKRMPDGTTRERWVQLGVSLTCDEWPAASWIEGGEGGVTSCVPQQQSCQTAGNPKVPGFATEQNWQGFSHNALATWFNAKTPKANQNGHEVDWTIFKFDFEIVDDAKIDYAAWVEVGGKKRYCYGPKTVNSADCKPEW